MTREKEIAVTVYIMIVSVLKMVDNPNATVSKGTRTIYNGLRHSFLRHQKGSSVRVADPEYQAINDKVIEAWDTTRREVVPKEGQLDSSLSELIQVLWDRMNRNVYQKLFISEKRIVAMINSIRDCPSNEKRTEDEIVEADNNARKLAFRFLELCDIKPRHNLSTRKKIIAGNLILENA